MSLAQRIVKLFTSPERFRAMEQESRQWFFVCSVCQYEKSYWDAGGIRYKAASVGKRRYVTCPRCSQRRWFKVIKRPRV